MTTHQSMLHPDLRKSKLGLTLPFKTVEQVAAERAAAAQKSDDANLTATLQKSIEQTKPAGDQPAADAPKTRKPRAKVTKKPAAPAKPRTAPLPMSERFKIADCIRQADPLETDAALAARISPHLLRPVNAQLVGKYRAELGLQPVKEVPASVLRSRIAELERQLELAKQPRLALDGGGEPGDPTDQVARDVAKEVLGVHAAAPQEGGAA